MTTAATMCRQGMTATASRRTRRAATLRSAATSWRMRTSALAMTSAGAGAAAVAVTAANRTTVSPAAKPSVAKLIGHSTIRGSRDVRGSVGDRYGVAASANTHPVAPSHAVVLPAAVRAAQSAGRFGRVARAVEPCDEHQRTNLGRSHRQRTPAVELQEHPVDAGGIGDLHPRSGRRRPHAHRG